MINRTLPTELRSAPNRTGAGLLALVLAVAPVSLRSVAERSCSVTDECRFRARSARFARAGLIRKPQRPARPPAGAGAAAHTCGRRVRGGQPRHAGRARAHRGRADGRRGDSRRRSRTRPRWPRPSSTTPRPTPTRRAPSWRSRRASTSAWATRGCRRSRCPRSTLGLIGADQAGGAQAPGPQRHRLRVRSRRSQSVQRDRQRDRCRSPRSS